MEKTEKKEEIKIEVPPEIDYKEIFNKWTEDNLNIIKENLEGYFPNNWDLIYTEQRGRDDAIIDYISKKEIQDLNKMDTTEVGGGFLGNTKYQILIHFPEIIIRNSEGRKHTIKDLYIIICLSSAFTNSQGNILSSYFGGFRATKTLDEFNYNYGHSHLSHTIIEPRSNIMNIFSAFCLGNTKLASICGALNYQFDEDKFTLFCQQLRDYVSWESLEGGPYRRIREIGSSSQNMRSVNNVSESIKKSYYVKFLAKYGSDFGYSLNNTLLGFSIIINTSNRIFEEQVTDIVDETDKVYYNSSTAQYYLLNTTNNDIDSINKRFNGNIFFKFKGNPVEFKIEESTKEEKNNIENNLKKVANYYITNYIITKLTNLINPHIRNVTVSINHNN